MSLTTLSLMAGALGGFPPTSGVTVALRSREETRRAALKAEAPATEILDRDGDSTHPFSKHGKRQSQRRARKIRMARKRRRGWL